MRGFVIEELSEIPSNWRVGNVARRIFEEMGTSPARKELIPARLTRHLRTRGAMKACLTTEEISPEEATQEAIKGEGVIGMDYVREVSSARNLSMGPRGQTE